MTHMNNFVSFGSPSVFEIAARWTDDREPRSRLPHREGWSTGDLRITVGGQVLTAHKFNGKARNHISWYLAPVVEWLITNWTWLFHEESYSWPDKSGQPAAVATFFAMERTIGSDDASERDAYAKIQTWWMRHALRASDSSAIYPDIYFRRVNDDIEVSWQSRQPVYAPQSFTLMLAPGYMLLPVESVAEPLWKFLEWATNPPNIKGESDRAIVGDLQMRLAQLKNIPLSQLELTYVNSRVRRLLETARDVVNWKPENKVMESVPVISELDSSVLMFGGLDVQIRENDAVKLMGLLSKQRNGQEQASLSRLVANPRTDAWMRPYEEGYELADDLRDMLGIEPDELFVDIHKVLRDLNIEIVETKLETDEIRGVAIAGRGFAPAILINTNSIYNCNSAGKRFTLAHELCHILYDRTRARKISHLSGPWTSARTEKRANAFAVMFLASTTALRKSLVKNNPDEVHALAEKVGLGFLALVEHLFNINLIGDTERELLRPQCH